MQSRGSPTKAGVLTRKTTPLEIHVEYIGKGWK